MAVAWKNVTLAHITFMKLKRSFTLLFLVLYNAIPAYGQTLLNNINQQWIQQRQKTILQNSEQQRKSLASSTLSTPHVLSVLDNTNSPCEKISTFNWNDTAGIDSGNRWHQRWEKNYINRCLTIGDMQQLANKATNDLIIQGFVTSRVVLPPQQVKNGILTLDVDAGYIEKIMLDGHISSGLKMLFPGSKGNVLNLRKIEQGLDQINRLPSEQVTINIEPGTRPGYSIIDLKRTSRKIPIEVELDTDNKGQKSTGVNEGNINLIWDSPLGIFDQWNVGAGSDLEFKSKAHNRYISAGVSIPYGAWTFGLEMNNSNSLESIDEYDHSWPYSEKNYSQQFYIHKLLFRDKYQKLTFTDSLQHILTDTELAHQKLTVSSPNLLLNTVGIDYSTTIKNGYLTLDPSITQGISGLGISKPSNNQLPSNHPLIWTLSASYYYPIEENLDYTTSLTAQTTAKRLYNIQQLSVGGDYSVRGYINQYLSGNRGGYWRNQLDWIPSFIPNYIGQPVITAALDGGWIDSQKNQVMGGGILGTSISVSLDNKYASQSITIGFPIAYPSTLHPSHLISYWQINFTI
ncbi:hypothetical protein LMG33818_000812 [Halomonadaceae bacterium LMG 33818]|uniref:ShlB/FhaC/HecB family hemolysin secretion/activation protein n=1 Tax=Cernens ardua TaxID=3402176 RepID=UPI003EDC45A7